jgi:hypothetical protein
MMKTWLKATWHSLTTQRVLVVCFVISALVQLSGIVYMLHSKSMVPSPRYDATEYRVLAQNILQHDLFSTSPISPYLPELLRTPGYPLVLSLSYLIEPSGYLMLCLHILFRLAIGWMIYATCRRRLQVSYWISLCGTCFWLFDIYTIFIGYVTLSDTFFAFLLCLSLYLALFSSEHDSYFKILRSPLVLGFAIITRPQGLVFAPILLTIFFLQRVRSFKRVIAILICLCLFPAIWLGRNFLHTGHFVLSSSGEYNLALGIHWAGDSQYFQRLVEAESAHFTTPVDLRDGKGLFKNYWIYTVQGYPTLRATFEDLLRAYPLSRLAWIQLKTLPTIWYPSAQMAIFASASHLYTPLVTGGLFMMDLATMAFLVLGAATSVIVLLKNPRRRESSIIILLGSAAFLGSWLNAGLTIQRLRTPVLPLALIVCVFGFQRLIEWVRSLPRVKGLLTPAQIESQDAKTRAAA